MLYSTGGGASAFAFRRIDSRRKPIALAASPTMSGINHGNRSVNGTTGGGGGTGAT